MPVGVLAAIQYGGYVNPWKAGILLVLLVIWAKLLTWIDKDSIAARLPREIINTGTLGSLIAGYFLYFFLPFGLAIGLLCGFFAADIGAYLFLRSRTIGLTDLTQQLKDWWGGLFRRGGPREVKVVAGSILIMDKNGVGREVPASDSPDLIRYDAAQLFLTRPLRLGAERLDLVAGEPTAVTFIVDGTRYDGDAMDRNKAGAAVQYLKDVSGLDMNERRKPQTSTFRAALDGKKHTIQITSFGSTAGESVRLLIDPKERQNFKMDSLGFTEDQLAIMKGLIEGGGGVVLLAAPKGHGLTSLCYGVIRAHDAFLYHVHTVERAPEFDLEGVTQNALPEKASPAEEAKQVNWVVSQEPDILMVTSVEDPKSAQDLAKFASGERRVYVGLRAHSALEALKLWRKMVGDDSLAMKNLRAVVAGRLVRRLCSACKVGYTPDPNMLRKLNMNPDAVGKLYQARKEPMRDAKGQPVPCMFCHDLAFHGRFGIFEVMTIDDEIRNVVKSGGTDNLIRQAQRKQRGKSLQEVALQQVQAGETSVEEVLRVLKSDSEPGKPRSGGSSPPTPRSSGPGPAGKSPSRPPQQPRPAGK